MSIAVRPLAAADLDAADHISVAAYGSPRSRRDGLARALALQPDGLLLAECDGEPAGVGSVVRFGQLAWIGAVAVAPAMQRRGIARALLEDLLTWVERQGCTTALLDASPSGEGLYRQVGFVDEDLVHRYLPRGWAGHAAAVGTEAPGPRIAPLRPRDLPELDAFDAPLFGASRLALLSSLLADYPERAWLSRDQAGAIDGYLLAQETTIGPWATPDPGAGAALLDRALRLPYLDAPGVIVPARNLGAATLLARHGFAIGRTLRHMRLGQGPTPAQRAHIWGQASFAWG